MSEMYEGVVFRADEPRVRQVFDTVSSRLRLRLVRLGADVYGIYRVAGRSDNFDPAAVEDVAERVSCEVGRSVALFYDNGCGVRTGVSYTDGRREREFGDADAWWVPYADDGSLVLNGPRYRVAELDPAEEYDCVHTAIDAALGTIAPGAEVNTALVEQASCYQEAELLAERGV